jgi:hypothetical protein
MLDPKHGAGDSVKHRAFGPFGKPRFLRERVTRVYFFFPREMMSSCRVMENDGRIGPIFTGHSCCLMVMFENAFPSLTVFVLNDNMI